MSTLNLLHTSDWHLGQNLHGYKRYEESKNFLDWLLELLKTKEIHVLLVAGDVFDTTTPTNKAQKLYYDFLNAVRNTGCRHVVIVGGNHDSPTFLNAPAGLLRGVSVQVLGESLDSPADEVLTLRKYTDGAEGAAGADYTDGATGADYTDGAAGAAEPEMLVCAVPYLRDRVICQLNADDTPGDMEQQRANGICRHYKAVLAAAREQRAALKTPVPLVVMGHLFTVGGQVAADEGVRNLYVGALGGVPASIFPPDADYVALGHLHTAQMVAKNPHWLYSGAPLPMSFGEGQRGKKVVLVRFDGVTPQIEPVPVPVFLELALLEGDWETIRAGLAALKARGTRALVDVNYTGESLMSGLGEEVAALTQGSSLEVLRIRNSRSVAAALARSGTSETLQDMSVHALFDRLLEQRTVPEEQRESLRGTYREAVTGVLEQDSRAQ